MNKASLLLLLLLLVAIATGLVLWAEGGLGPGSLPGAPAALPKESRAAPSPLRAAGTDPREGVPGEGLPEGLRAIDRAEVDAARIDLLVVQVWDREPGVPAPAAEVFVVDGFEGPELSDPFAQHWSDLAESRGQRFSADSEGRVELPEVEDWAIVTARLPGSYGFAKVGPEHAEVEEVLLLPDETVTVRVVDGEDRPVAGVPVGVIQHVPLPEEKLRQVRQLEVLEQQMAEVLAWMEANPEQREDAVEKLTGMRRQAARLRDAMGGSKAAVRTAAGAQAGKRPARQPPAGEPSRTTAPDLRARRRTDDSGLAVFRHFQLYRHEQESWWPAAQVGRFEAVLLMPLAEPAAVAFTGRPVPAEALELRLPPTGSLALRTVDLDGRPYRGPVQAVLRMLRETAVWTRVDARKAQDEEQILFPFVGLGLQLAAACRLGPGTPGKQATGKGGDDAGGSAWTSPPFPGPAIPGERVTVDLVVAPDSGMLFGRVVDDAGDPLGGARPAFSIEGAAGPLVRAEVTLDPEGRFHLPYRVEGQPGPFRLVIRRTDEKPTPGLAMRLPALPAGRVTDLGELRISVLGSIAHGSVVDDLGRPVAGARVQLQRERQDAGAAPARAMRSRRPAGRQPRPAPPARPGFVDEPYVSDRTDGEGRYQLFAGLEPGRYRLRVDSPDHFPLETPEPRAGQQLDLQLLRISRLVGTVVLPDWMPASRVRAQLQPAADPGAIREDQIHAGKAGGETRVYFDRVRPGVYDLSLRVQDFPDPVLRIDGIEIEPGQTGVHPRLRGLDLGALVYHFEVHAVDGSGRPFKPSAPVLLARIARMDGSEGLVGIAWGGGGSRAEILSASPQLEVIPYSAGYRSRPAVLGPGVSQLQYLRIPPVALHLPGFRALVGATEVHLTVELAGGSALPDELGTWNGRSARIANWYRQSRSTTEQLGRTDSVEVSVMVDGRYRVTAHLVGDRKVAVELGEVDVELEPGGPAAQVTVPYDPAAVQAGLAELGGW